MFDIGFTEILLISVIAILVVGPKDLPVLMRTVGRLFARARSLAGEVRSELHREIARTEELARRIERETEIAELHKIVDETKATIPVDMPGGNARSGTGNAGGSAASSGADTPTVSEIKPDDQTK